jgi:hydroxymethylglutaryl-CoA lyase
MANAPAIKIVEVGPRDGLQSEPYTVPTSIKVELIDRLADAGLGVIETTSFVSDQAIPQLSDAESVYARLNRREGVRYPALVPNERGYERARAAGINDIAVFTAASEAFNQHNINCSIEQAMARFAPVIARAQADGVSVRGYVSTVMGCPYQGDVPVNDVVRVCEALHSAGCYEVSLGDTIGVGTTRQAQALIRSVAQSIPIEQLAIHFHDTYGQALANIFACLELGVKTIDSSVAGLGGCPYARGATGNVATEDVIYMLDGMGLSTGVDLWALAQTGRWIAAELGRPHSRAGQAVLKTRQ